MNRGRTVRKRTGQMSSVTNKKIFGIFRFEWGSTPKIRRNLVLVDRRRWGIAGLLDRRG